MAIKGILFLLFFASLLGIAYTGTLFHKKKGWMAALFSFLSPALFFEATKFENDQFAIPILIWSAYFFYKARITKEKKNDLIGLALVFFAAGFWYGSIYWLLAFALSSLIVVIPMLLSVPILREQLITNILPRAVVESQAFNGIALIGGLALGFSLLPQLMWPQTAIFLLLTVLQVKFAWMLVLPLSIGVLMFYVNPKLEQNKSAKQVKGILLVAAIFMVVAWGLSVQGHPPNSHHWNAIDLAIEQSNGEMISNDWDMGYWIMYKGGKPLQFGGGTQIPFEEGIAITRFDSKCELIEQFKDTNVLSC